MTVDFPQDRTVNEFHRIRCFVPFLLVALAAGCGGSDTTGPGGGGGGDEVATVEVSPSSVTLAVGGTESLTATARTADGTTVSAAFTWSSQDEEVATVSSSGLVTAVGPGSTVVEARTGNVSGSAAVAVLAEAPAAPSDLHAIAGSPDRVSLSWTDNSSSETGFEVERSLQASGGFESVGTTDADITELVDESVQPSTTYYYRVRALGEGEASDFSDVAEATTLDPPDPASPFECERQAYPCTWAKVDPTVFDESDQLGDQMLQMFDDGQSVAEVLTWISQQPHVVDAIANDEVIRFRLRGGRPTWVSSPLALLLPEGAPGPGPEPLARPRPSAPSGPRPAVVGDNPKSKHALVMSVYQHQLAAWDPSPQIVQILSGARGYEGNVDYYANTAEEQQITVEQFKGWGAYDAIHLFTHGNQICEEGGDCHTVVRAGKTNRGLILSSTDKGVDMAKVDYGEQDTNLSTDFFREQYPGGLPNTIVYISACRTTKGQDLEQTLAGSGGVYLGWTETVWADTAEKAAIAFFQRLVSKGVTATSGFESLREGDDLTLDRQGRTGAFATLDIYHGGDDLRIREVVYPRNPLTKEDLPQDAPYPVVGQPEDGEPDDIPYLVKVDGVDGDPAGFVVHVKVNGFSADPKPLSEGKAIDGEGNVWQVKGKVPVTFDAQQGQPIDVEVTVDLPEGGKSEWDEMAELGNPELRYRSTIESEGGQEPIVDIVSRVKSDFKLSLDEDLEKLTGDDDLSYEEFTVQVRSDCSVTTTTQDGTLEVVDGDFTWTEGQPAVPERLVIFIPPTISETIIATCPEGTGTQNTIHYFAAFYSFHGGELCGSENEVDEAAGGVVIRDWVPGSGEVMARKTYDRSCTVDEATFTENTVLELIDPREVGGG